MAKRKETECAVGNRQDEEEILKTYQTEDYDYLAEFGNRNGLYGTDAPDTFQ